MRYALITLLCLVLTGPAMMLRGAGASDPQVRALLEEGLRLYGERQYVRALDLFKQVQRVDPNNATAAEYVKSSEQRILEWENQGDSPAQKKGDADWDSLLNSKPKKGGDVQTNANDLIAARRSLVERMKNRAIKTENIVQINDTKRGIEVTLFHDQLFLPGLQTLRDEALPILDNVSQLIRSKGDREVTIISQARTDSNDPFLLFPEIPQESGTDPTLPQMKDAGSSMLFQDIEAIRSMILFTYIAQRSMGQDPNAIVN